MRGGHERFIMYNHKHPYKNSPEYRAWLQMNRSHRNEVDESWKWIKGQEEENFSAYHKFRACVGPRPGKDFVLIRLHKEHPCSGGNVRWGTHVENSKARGPMKKFSCARDEELIAEIERRGYVLMRGSPFNVKKYKPVKPEHKHV